MRLASWIAVAALLAGLVGVLVVLVMDVAGLRPLGRGRRWQGSGIALDLCGILASAFAQGRSWPAAQLQLVHDLTLAFVLPGTALLAAGLVIGFRRRGRSLGNR